MERFFRQSFFSGQADSIYSGPTGSLADAVGVDLFSTPGVVKAAQSMVKDSGVIITDFCQWKILASDGNQYWFADTGNVYKRTTTGVWSKCYDDSAAILGAEEFDGYIYWATATALHRITTALASSEATWSTLDVGDVFPATLTTSSWHPMVKSGLYLFIGNATQFATVDDVGAFKANGTQEVTFAGLPHNHLIKCLAKFGIDIIAGTQIDSSTTSARVFRWDTVSPTYNSDDDIPEIGVNAFIVDDNYVYAQCGLSGNIYYYDGKNLIKKKKIKGDYANKTMTVHPGSVCNFQGIPLFGVSNVLSNPCNQGVYALGRYSELYPLGLVLEYPLSHTKFSGTETGALMVSGNTLYAAWKDSAVITMTIADPCVVTWAAHGLANGTPILFTTTIALPTGITASTYYYARSTGTNTFNLYDTAAHAVAGGTTGRVATTGSQDGVHTGANYGVDAISWTAKYASAYITTLVLGGEEEKKKDFKNYILGYSALPASTALTLSYAPNYGTSYTSITITDESDYYRYRGKTTVKANVIQLKTSLTVSANNSPELKVVYCDWNTSET